jgi:hypothetical protein
MLEVELDMRFSRPVANVLCAAVMLAATALTHASDETSTRRPSTALQHAPRALHASPGHSIPAARAESSADFLLTGLVITMLVAYQLRRKHRFLRPRPFSL